MKITLSFEKTVTSEISIMVDAFRASTSITIAMDNFNQVIPAFSPEEAKKVAETHGAVLAGERMGAILDGFDVGNSPVDIKNYETEQDTLVLTTSNGTRILKDMDSLILIGTFINARAVAKAAIEIAKKNNYTEIDVVMAGWKGQFAIEDFLASGEILYWIKYELNERSSSDGEQDSESEVKISEYAQSAILASRDYDLVKKTIYNSRSAKGLKKLGYERDIDFSIQKNISKNVVIYKNDLLKLIQ